MPANIVKPGEEKKWEAAKKEAKKEYTTGDAKGKKKLNKDKFWATVTTIFKNMAHKESVNDILKYGTDEDIQFLIEKYGGEELEILNEMFSLDKAKNAMGDEIYNTINQLVRNQDIKKLEQWLIDGQKEYEREEQGTERKYRLYYEIEYLKYILGKK